MNKIFASFIKDFGTPVDAMPCTKETAQSLQGRLPNGLIEMWQDVGIGVMLDGRFQFCLPDHLQPLVNLAVGHDRELDRNLVAAYGYSAFGLVYAWHGQHGRFEVDLLHREIVTRIPFSDEGRERRLRNGPDVELAIELSGIEDVCDTEDEEGELLFEPALSTLGPLRLGECYGFVPAIGLGGALRLKYLRKLRALEHFSIIGALGSYKWLNVASGTRTYVRQVEQ